MKVYRYGLERRPLQLGAQPRGFIIDSTLIRPYGQPDIENPLRRFGCIDYAEKLSDEDVRAYELNFLGEVERAEL
jgi:hypothetical protein